MGGGGGVGSLEIGGGVRSWAMGAGGGGSLGKDHLEVIFCKFPSLL